MTNTEWKDFEKLVAHVQAGLVHGAAVYPNHHVLDQSGNERELDVAIYLMAGPYPLLVAVEAKRHSRPVGVEKVEAFVTKLRDVGAHKGIMVSNKGFQKGARAKARRHDITLLTYHEAVTQPWVQFLEVDLYGQVVYREIENPVCTALLKINDDIIRVPLPISTKLVDHNGKFSTIEREFWSAWLIGATGPEHLGPVAMTFEKPNGVPLDEALFVDYQNQQVEFVGAEVDGHLKLQICEQPLDIKHEGSLVDQDGKPLYHRAIVWIDPDQIRAARNCRDLTSGDWAVLKRDGFGSYGYEYRTEYSMEYYAGLPPRSMGEEPPRTKGGGVFVVGRIRPADQANDRAAQPRQPLRRRARGSRQGRESLTNASGIEPPTTKEGT